MKVENIHQENDQQTYTLMLQSLDLSSYEVGDRVLVANIDFPFDLENTAGVSMDGEGSYPMPTSEHGVTLVSAVNTSTSESLGVVPEVSGQFMPMIYDANDDGKVGLADFAAFISNYGRKAIPDNPQTYRFDFNRDGKVGLPDFALFISHYGDRKFPAEPLSRSSVLLDGEPIGDSRLVELFEGESDPSVYWGAAARHSDILYADDQELAGEESPGGPDPETAPFDVSDSSWDARLVDAAVRGNELFLASRAEEDLEEEETYAAEW